MADKVTKLPKVLLVKVKEGDDRVATLTRARASYVCWICGRWIFRGDWYYVLIIGGGGLESKINPRRVHTDCLPEIVHEIISKG